MFAIILIAAQFAATTGRTQRVLDESDERIVNGKPAQMEKFPSMVAVLARVKEEDDAISFRAFCGGTLIDPSWVLTAAHCVSDDNGDVAAAASFRIVEGAHYHDPGDHLFKVRRVVRHPSYDSHHTANDIALFELAKPSRAQPQLLVSQALRARMTTPGTKATVVGWGQTTPKPAPWAGTGPAKDLLQATLPIVSLERCRQVYPPTAEMEYVHDHNVCAGLDEGGTDSCHGDSGGPLFTQHPTMGNTEIGVVSFGPGGACAQAGKFGVYTSVGDFESFIRQYVPNASFATEAGSSSGAEPAGGIGDAQPPKMPPPGESPQVTVDVLPSGPIHLNTPVAVRVSSSDAGLLMLFARDAEGHVTQLFPNRYTAANSSALVAGREIRAGATVTVPGPGDGFRIKAQEPLGETVVIAVVAPPEAKIADLIERHQGLDEIVDWNVFSAELGERLRTASVAKAGGGSASRALAVEEARPAIAMAERHFDVLP